MPDGNGALTPAEQAYLVQINAATRHVPPDLRRQLQAEAVKSQRVILSLPYWSKIRFKAVRAGAGPYTYTISRGYQVVAFSYAQGLSRVGAGFATGAASLADTNLVKPSETNDNADVRIWGLGCEICPNSMPDLLAQLWTNVSIDMSLSGSDQIRLGTLNMFPSAGGLFGAAMSMAQAGNLIETAGAELSYFQNGNPQSGNFGRFPQFFRWNRNSSDQKDTSLTITFTVQEDIVVAGNDRAAVAGAAPGASGRVEPFTAATDAQAFVDLRIRLQSESLSARSNNT